MENNGNRIITNVMVVTVYNIVIFALGAINKITIFTLFAAFLSFNVRNKQGKSLCNKLKFIKTCMQDFNVCRTFATQIVLLASSSVFVHAK